MTNPAPAAKPVDPTPQSATAKQSGLANWLTQNQRLVISIVGVLVLSVGVLNFLTRNSPNNPAASQPGVIADSANNPPGITDNSTAVQPGANAAANVQPGTINNPTVNQPGSNTNAAVNEPVTRNNVANQPGLTMNTTNRPGKINNVSVNQPGANTVNMADFQQWWNSASSFYQEYVRLNQEYESVAQRQGVTPQQATEAYRRMILGFQQMNGQLGRLQPPGGVSREDAANMVQTKKIWANLLTAEIQVGRDYLQYAERGQKPPEQFLKVTMPQLMQTKDRSFQQLQQTVANMTARHQANFAPQPSDHSAGDTINNGWQQRNQSAARMSEEFQKSLGN